MINDLLLKLGAVALGLAIIAGGYFYVTGLIDENRKLEADLKIASDTAKNNAEMAVKIKTDADEALKKAGQREKAALLRERKARERELETLKLVGSDKDGPVAVGLRDVLERLQHEGNSSED